jgi:hypothetical protein
MDRYDLLGGRDADLDMKAPEQADFVTSQDAETTWFLLYKPSNPTSSSGSRTVFGKGNPAIAGSSSYLYYSQRTINSPPGQFSTYDQMMGMAVIGDSGSSAPNARGAVVGIRTPRITFSTLMQLAGRS